MRDGSPSASALLTNSHHPSPALQRTCGWLVWQRRGCRLAWWRRCGRSCPKSMRRRSRACRRAWVGEGVLAGQRDAFQTLITRYSDPLYRHALCMTGSPDVAEDILQLSFIKAYQHLAEVRGRFDAWVFRIVANGCKDWLKNIRRSHLSYDEDDQPSSFANPEEELDRTELRSDLDVALSALPASLREAFVMKHVEGRSYEEMADLLGTTVGALKMRVHRAREALQALLEEKYA